MKWGSRQTESQSFSYTVHAQTEADNPDCIKGEEGIVVHFDLLLKLGKVAFYALFDAEGRKLITFEFKFAKQFLEINELEECLHNGLLS